MRDRLERPRGADLDPEAGAARLAEAGDGGDRPAASSSGDAIESDQRLASVLSLAAARLDLDAPHPDAFYGGVRDALAQETGLGPFLRSRPTPTRLAIAAGTAGVLFVAVLLGAPRADLAVYPGPRLVAVGSTFVAFAAAALHLALRPLQGPALPLPQVRFVVLLGLAALFGLHGLPAAHLAHHSSLPLPGGEEAARTAICFGVGTVAALGLLWWFGQLDRGGQRSPPRALLVAAAGGLVANLLLHAHCPATAPIHLLLGHAGAALVALAGVVLLRR